MLEDDGGELAIYNLQQSEPPWESDLPEHTQIRGDYDYPAPPDYPPPPIPEEEDEAEEDQPVGPGDDPNQEHNHDPTQEHNHVPDQEQNHVPNQEQNHDPTQEHNHNPDQEQNHDPNQEDSHDPTQGHNHVSDQEQNHVPNQELNHDPDQEQNHDPTQEHNHDPDQEHNQVSSTTNENQQSQEGSEATPAPTESIQPNEDVPAPPDTGQEPQPEETGVAESGEDGPPQTGQREAAVRYGFVNDAGGDFEEITIDTPDKEGPPEDPRSTKDLKQTKKACSLDPSFQECQTRTSQMCADLAKWYWDRPYLRLAWMLASTAANQVLVILAIVTFRMDHSLIFQALGLAFHVGPYIAVCAFCCKNLHDAHSWHALEAAMVFPFAPYVMLAMSAVFSIRQLHYPRPWPRPHTGPPIQQRLEAATTFASLWGILAAAPQVYLQVTAAHVSPDKTLLLLASINLSMLKASCAQISHLTLSWWWRPFGVVAILGSMGSRVWLVASLYSLPGWWRYSCWGPVALSFLAAWVTRCARLGTPLASPVQALRNALVLPPTDIESVVGILPWVLGAGAMVHVRPISAFILLGALAASQYLTSWLWRAMMAMQKLDDNESDDERGCGVEEPCTYQ